MSNNIVCDKDSLKPQSNTTLTIYYTHTQTSRIVHIMMLAQRFVTQRQLS